MVSLELRKKDILDLVKKLDISPSMYKNATEKYKNVATYLEENGANADIYPQGSFALGTIIRPYSKDKECAYDLDFICQHNDETKETGAQEVKEKLGNILRESDLYSGKLIECDECYTIEYSKINDIEFRLDIVPAVDENEAKKIQLASRCKNPDLVTSSIAIPSRAEWITNNPKGYKKWFDSINAPFKDYNRVLRRQALFESASATYKSIEELPEELERSSLQRVIQIIKYHRNVYFSNKPTSVRPLSAIITTLVAQISQYASTDYDVFDLLAYVLKELTIYSKYQVLNESVFKSTYQNKNIISRNEGKWKIENPANPDDNLADTWNENKIAASDFFKWITFITKDLISSLSASDTDFKVLLESAFGYAFVNAGIDLKKYSAASQPTFFTQSARKKPWGGVDCRQK